MAAETPTTLPGLVARARRPVGQGSRLGITGAPGAGKSTLCAALMAALGDRAVLVSKPPATALIRSSASDRGTT